MPAHERRAEVAPEIFRQVLGQYPTGVTAITGMTPSHEPAAMIVGTFSSVSLDPPLVSFMPTRTSNSYANLLTSEVLCANVLSMDQEALCRALARPGGPEKFDGIEWAVSPNGAPILSGNSAWIEFSPRQTVEAGDHDIVIGEVSHLGIGTGGLPLLFLGGGYGRYTAHSRIMPATADSLRQIRWAEAVKDELERLSRSLGLEVVFVSLIDDAIVQVASYGNSGAGARPHPLGVKLPLGAPMGAPIIASTDENARRNWLKRSFPNLSEESIQEHFATLDRVRDRGWAMSLMSAGIRDVDATLRTFEEGRITWEGVPLDPDLSRPRAYGAELPYDDDAVLNVRNVSGSVRDDEGTPLFYLSLFGYGQNTSSDFIRRSIAELLSASTSAARIVTGLH